MGIGGITIPYGLLSSFLNRYNTERAVQNISGTSFMEQMQKAQSAANKKSHIVYMKTDDMLYSGGNGTGLSFYIKYAENSTEDDPVVTAKGVDENGNEFEQTIHINKINPKSATIVEMRALEAYTGVKKQYGFTSLPLDTGNMGLNDRRDFIKMFQNTIRDMSLLGQRNSAAYYLYSMQTYSGFMDMLRY